MPNFKLTKALCIGSTNLFGFGRLVLILRQTETIGLQQFSLLILNIRR